MLPHYIVTVADVWMIAVCLTLYALGMIALIRAIVTALRPPPEYPWRDLTPEAPPPAPRIEHRRPSPVDPTFQPLAGERVK